MNRGTSESKKQHQRKAKQAQKASAEASETGLASTGMLFDADTGCYSSPQSPILVGRERVCAFGNGSSELCYLCKNNLTQRRGNSNEFNIMVKHMRITDCGNEISSDTPPIEAEIQ